MSTVRHVPAATDLASSRPCIILHGSFKNQFIKATSRWETMDNNPSLKLIISQWNHDPERVPKTLNINTCVMPTKPVQQDQQGYLNVTYLTWSMQIKVHWQ